MVPTKTDHTPCDVTILDQAPPAVTGKTFPAGRCGLLDVVREIGSGAAGQVYEARNAETGIRYVVKTLRSQRRTALDVVRFTREARVMSKVRHPNIMPIFHFGVAADPPYYVMPHRDGITLADLVRREGSLPYERVVRIARDVCFGLAEVHRLGIVHRDIKPANLLIEADGRAVLLDFGLARVTLDGEEQVTAPGTVLGTPAYMSPEQCVGEPVGDRADVYSLAVTIFELLTGRNPFQDASLLTTIKRHQRHVPARLDALLPSKVEEEFGELVYRMLNKEPAKRPRAESCLETFAGLVRRLDMRKGWKK